MSRYVAVAEDPATNDMFAVGPYDQVSGAMRAAGELADQGYDSYCLRLEYPADVTGGVPA